MAISDTEARRLFDQLALQLRAKGAGTLVDQVIDEISQGKQIIYKTISSRGGFDIQRAEADELFPTGRSRRQYAETLQYSSHERLELLLQALDRAIFDVLSIDTELVKRFGKIRFVPEQEEGRGRNFELGSLQVQSALIDQLKSVIAKFRSFIGE